ncbi:hypothetical protein ACP4OV_006734 [Aristida adscensionis]
MAIHTGSRCSSSTSTARRTAPPAAASLVIRRRPSSRNLDAGDGMAARARRRCSMEVRRKMEELRRLLVPTGGDGGGDGDRCIDADELFLHAAGYIARLQAQVQVMQLMVDVLEGTQD